MTVLSKFSCSKGILLSKIEVRIWMSCVLCRGTSGVKRATGECQEHPGQGNLQKGCRDTLHQADSQYNCSQDNYNS